MTSRTISTTTRPRLQRLTWSLEVRLKPCAVCMMGVACHTSIRDSAMRCAYYSKFPPHPHRAAVRYVSAKARFTNTDTSKVLATTAFGAALLDANTGAQVQSFGGVSNNYDLLVDGDKAQAALNRDDTLVLCEHVLYDVRTSKVSCGKWLGATVSVAVDRRACTCWAAAPNH